MKGCATTDRAGTVAADTQYAQTRALADMHGNKVGATAWTRADRWTCIPLRAMPCTTGLIHVDVGADIRMCASKVSLFGVAAGVRRNSACPIVLATSPFLS